MKTWIVCLLSDEEVMEVVSDGPELSLASAVSSGGALSGDALSSGSVPCSSVPSSCGGSALRSPSKKKEKRQVTPFTPT